MFQLTRGLFFFRVNILCARVLIFPGLAGHQVALRGISHSGLAWGEILRPQEINYSKTIFVRLTIFNLTQLVCTAKETRVMWMFIYIYISVWAVKIGPSQPKTKLNARHDRVQGLPVWPHHSQSTGGLFPGLDKVWNPRKADIARKGKSGEFQCLPKLQWMEKSCTSWWVVYPIIYGAPTIQGGAGFLPSSHIKPGNSWKSPCGGRL